MTRTRVVRHIRAPRSDVYRALVDARAIATWRVPDNMTAAVHAFDPRIGGEFRISLTYDSPAQRGKTATNTDTYRGISAADNETGTRMALDKLAALLESS